MTLKWGTGILGVGSECVPQRLACPFAITRATAIDTPMIALAPSRPLFKVPSSLIRAASRSASSAKSRPRRRSAISPFACPTARPTPWPSKRVGSSSRSSAASIDPVDAPDGTPARPVAPFDSSTATQRVGRARESKISYVERATTPITPGLPRPETTTQPR
jgi:hypothetical protein